MEREKQVEAFGNLAASLNEMADRLSTFLKDPANNLKKKRFLTEALFADSTESSANNYVQNIRQAAQLAEDHKVLAKMWPRPTKTGKFISMDDASKISENYVDRFGPSTDSSSTQHPTTPFGEKLPLFPEIMWFVSATKLRKITNLRTTGGREAELIRIYPGINMPENGEEEGNFTFIFAAEDVGGQLIQSDNMSEASIRELIEDKEIRGASVLEEIGTCSPCQRLNHFVSTSLSAQNQK